MVCSQLREQLQAGLHRSKTHFIPEDLLSGKHSQGHHRKLILLVIHRYLQTTLCYAYECIRPCKYIKDGNYVNIIITKKVENIVKYIFSDVCFHNSVILKYSLFPKQPIFHLPNYQQSFPPTIKNIICFFIVVDKTSFHCFSSQAVQILPTVLASSTSHYWCIISCMPYSFINCF